jgi:hypothetical protein
MRRRSKRAGQRRGDARDAVTMTRLPVGRRHATQGSGVFLLADGRAVQSSAVLRVPAVLASCAVGGRPNSARA